MIARAGLKSKDRSDLNRKEHEHFFMIQSKTNLSFKTPPSLNLSRSTFLLWTKRPPSLAFFVHTQERHPLSPSVYLSCVLPLGRRTGTS